MDQDGKNTKYLTLGNKLVLTPRFNPTSQLVAYLSYMETTPFVYLLNIKTGVNEKVGNFSGMTSAPRFSPDGTNIIMSLSKNGNSNIYIINLKKPMMREPGDHQNYGLLI